MRDEEAKESARRETIRELYVLVIAAQEMGRRLANETHGDSHPEVLELNEFLHQARVKLATLKEEVGEQSAGQSGKAHEF